METPKLPVIDLGNGWIAEVKPPPGWLLIHESALPKPTDEVPDQPVTPPKHWHSVDDYFNDMLLRWEGGFQAHPNDRGNYVNGVLIGTNRGVTPGALAQFRGVPPTEITREDMLALTHQEAALIGMRSYYQGPGFSKLTWSPVVEVATDYGWGSGPVTSITALQRIIGTNPDGVIGPQTIEAFEKWRSERSPEDAVNAMSDARYRHWDSISQPGSRNHVFRNGWLRRANFYRPNNPEWWGF